VLRIASIRYGQVPERHSPLHHKATFKTEKTEWQERERGGLAGLHALGLPEHRSIEQRLAVVLRAVPRIRKILKNFGTGFSRGIESNR
jgi:hypothetical protein